MARIEVVSRGVVLVLTVDGSLSADEVIGIIREQYTGQGILHVVWDLTSGSISEMTKGCFMRIAQATSEIFSLGHRQGGKTVFVRPSVAEYGLLRMYTAIALMSGVHAEYGVFLTLDEAKNFLLL